ncbi:MAG: 2-C-methyl-D-erythritol 4-phosphate cytidylyltransferase [Candidatus Omnitrophica bacterium]|nr:2-C-methyl-D-erythritol 4-phosphate cytidylyltransferase [Candidatus Omnitrophota bacterium]
MPVAAIVASGGTGRRLGSRRRKPFVPIGRRPIIAWTLKAMENSPAVDEVILVIHRGDVSAARRLIRKEGFKKVSRVVAGGATRMSSVFRGLGALSPRVKWVLVHDGARPLASPDLFERTLKAARRSGAAIAAVPVVPTVKEARGGWVKRTLDRKLLWAVQTPQAFRRDLLLRAHRAGIRRNLKATDDAALIEAIGGRVRIVKGSFRNIKVTTPEDLVVAEALLEKGVSG